jgi:hypothetical protein
MFELLDKLRAKPEGTKKQMAFLVALSLVGVIFVVWLTVVYPDMRRGQMQEAGVRSAEKSPLSAFWETVSGGFSSIGENISEVKEAVNSFASTTQQ